MRNVASRQVQKDEDEEPEVSNKWGSLPAINVADKEQHKSNGDDVQNDEEGLQEVSETLLHAISCCECYISRSILVLRLLSNIDDPIGYREFRNYTTHSMWFCRTTFLIHIVTL